MKTNVKKPISLLLSLLLVIGLLPVTSLVAHAANYTIYFNANGGSCGTAAVPVTTGSANYYDTSWNVPTKSGATFLGWFDGNGTQVYGSNGFCTNGTGYWSGNAWVYNGNVTVYAHWDKYTASFDANGGSGGVSSVTVRAGTSDYCDISWGRPSKPGADFTGWFDSAGAQAYKSDGWYLGGSKYWSSGGGWNYHGDVTFYAHWSTYTLTLDPNGGTVDISAVQVRPGSTDYFMLEGARLLPVKPGYTFTGWFDADGTQVYGPNNVCITGTKYWNGSSQWVYHHEVTVYAHWTPTVNTITYNANGGSVSPASANYTIESTGTLAEASRDNYIFDGWQPATDSGSWAAATVYPADTSLTGQYGSVTLTAQWTPAPYTLTLNANGGSVSSDTIDYNVESTGTLPQAAKEGYDFAGWKVTAPAGSWAADAVFDAGAALTNKYGDATLTAQWTVRHDTAYSINNYYMNEDGTYPAAPETQTFIGTTENVVTAVNAASAPASYTLDTALSDASVAIAGDGTAALNLYYARDAYTVTFNVDGAETSGSYYYGAVPAYAGATPALAATGENTYSFLGWTANAPAEPGSDAAYYAADNLPPVTADVTFHPYFGATVNSYDVTFPVDGVETTVSFPYGATPAFPGVPTKAADAHASYTFSGWSPAIAPVTGEAAYSAQFTATVKEYPVFVTSGAGSTVSIASRMVPHDTVVSFTVTIAEGYDPDTLAVTVNGADISALGEDQGNGVYAYSVRVLTDAAVNVADLTKFTYDITFVAGDETVTKTVPYGEVPVYGKTPAKAATAQYSYTFTGWDNEIVPATEDASYTAQFDETPVKYLITAASGKGASVSPGSLIWEFGGNVQLLVTVEEGYDPDSLTVLANGDPLTLSSQVETGYVYTVYVDGDVTVTIPDLEKYTYTITFKVGDTETKKTVAYGETPDFGSVPTKAADDENFYAFSGWEPAIVPATANAAYTAQFAATPIPAHTHECTAFVRTVLPTCVSAGYDEYVCECGMTAQLNPTELNAANHAKDPILVGKREATETEDGYSGDLICPACGETVTAGHVEPKTAVPHVHDFSTLVSHTDATCAAKACDVYACACGETQTVETGEVDPNNHVGLKTVGAREATTEEYGYTGDQICTACGEVLATGSVIDKTVTPHTHDFNTVADSGEATCVAKAYTVMQCACGETRRTETGDLNADNHAGSIILVGAREATATAGGYTGDKVCTACGKTVETGTFTDPTDPGHTHDYTEAVETGEATCVAKAYTVYQCACGDTKKVETGEVNADNHAGEIKTLGAREATATVDGYSGDKYCLACGKLVEAGHVIEHTGSAAPDTPVNPDAPDDGGSNTDTRVSFFQWLIDFFKKILAFFKLGGESSVC